MAFGTLRYLPLIASFVFVLYVPVQAQNAELTCPRVAPAGVGSNIDSIEYISGIEVDPLGTEVIIITSRGIYGHDPYTLERLSIITCRQFPSGNYIARWSPDGKRIAAFLSENTGTQIFDAETGALLNTLRGDQDPSVYVNGELGGAFPIYDIAWSPDGQQLATIGQLPMRVWDVASETLLFEQSDLSYDPFDYDPDNPRLLAWSPDGQQLALAMEDEVFFWEVENFTLVDEVQLDLPTDLSEIHYIDWAHNYLAIGGHAVSLQILDTESQIPTHPLHDSHWVHCVAWNPLDANIVAAIGSEGEDPITSYEVHRFISIINVANESIEQSFEHENFLPDDIVWHPNGRYIYSVDIRIGLGNIVYLWDVENGDILAELSIS